MFQPLLLSLLFIGASGTEQGEPVADPDTRQVLQLNPQQRVHVLEEMQTFLLSTQLIMEGLAEEDRELIAEAAREAASAGKGHGRGLGMQTALPPEFRQFGQATKKQFIGIAEQAESGASDEEILTSLSVTLSSCNACHAIYQIERVD